MMTTLAVVALLAAATPTLAQTPNPPKEQGLGIFLQGGYVRTSVFGPDANFFENFKPQGFIVGIGFGGNKSGAFGVGVDINYVWTTESDPDGLDPDKLKSQYLNIPVYGRFNIGGHGTKNAPTFYIPAGWFFDILLASKLGGTDIKDDFEGFQTGPLVGAGFEVARIGAEARFQWSLKQMLNTGEVVDAKQFTFILLLKVRLN